MFIKVSKSNLHQSSSNFCLRLKTFLCLDGVLDVQRMNNKCAVYAFYT